MELTRNYARGLMRRDCPLLLHLDLRQRLHGLVLVRFAVSLCIVAGAVFADRVVGISGLNVTGLSLLAVALFLCNTIYWLAVRYHHIFSHGFGARDRFLVRVLHVSVATDFIGLTVALWLVGGPFSPFKAFFIFNVIVASMLLSPRAAFTHASVAFVLLSGLVIGTWQGWIPVHYPEGAVVSGMQLSGKYVFTVLMVQGLLIMLTALLTTHLMHVLNRNSARLVETNQELESVSQLRRDFLQIALHNLRSPIGVVSMHLSNLANGYCGPLSEEQAKWIGRSQDRLQGLTNFLHDLEYLTALETEDLEKQIVPTDIAVIAKELVLDHQELAEKADHSLTLEPAPGVAEAPGIPRLIREALANYVVNAIKYTPRGGHVIVRVLDEPEAVRVEVEDNGIGISEEDRKRLFREMVRIQTPGSPLGEVAGSGLGLHIVHRIATMHGASINVQSQPGKGSTFAIAFPKSRNPAKSPRKWYTMSVGIGGDTHA